MLHKRIGLAVAWLVVPALAVVVALAGCHGGSTPSGRAAPAGTTAGAGSADALYASNGCSRCHGSMTQGGGRAPSLAHEGAGADHTAQWIADQIRDPKAHNPGSRMPAFEGKMADADVQALASALAARK